MYRAVGCIGSPDWQHVAVMNWARLARVCIGQPSHAGWAFFVEAPSRGSLCKFVIEHRGHGWPPVRIATSYLDRSRHHPTNRRTEFRRMITLFCRLTEQPVPKFK